MQRLEFYIPSRDSVVKGKMLDSVAGYPLKGTLPHIEVYLPDMPLVSLGESSVPLNGKDPSLSRPTELHGRSYHLHIPNLHETAEDYPLLFIDQYGNLFMDLNTKGNNLSAPAVKQDDTTRGFHFYGLADDEYEARVLKASDLMRRNGIDTEITLQVIEPQELPFGEDLLPIEEFKKRLLESISPDASKANKQMVGESLEQLRFHIIIRGVQVNERLWDLERLSEKMFWLVMEKAFRFVNQVEKNKALDGSSAIAQFYYLYHENGHPDNSDFNKQQVTNYFTGWLAKTLGRNYGRFHFLSLWHEFAHAGNISLTGGIYDLDSVQGEALGLGDGKNSGGVLTNEASFVFEQVNDVLSSLIKRGLLSTEYDTLERFKRNFWSSYVKERLGGEVLTHMDQAQDLCLQVGLIEYTDTLSGAAHYFENLITAKGKTDLEPTTDALKKVVKRFGPKDANKIIEAISLIVQPDSYAAAFNALFESTVGKLGWDKDVMRHLEDIHDLFAGNYGTKHKDVPLKYYDLATAQLGWTPDPAQIFEGVEVSFLNQEVREAEHDIGIAIIEGGGEDLIELIRETVSNREVMPFSNYLTLDRWPRVLDQFKSQYPDESKRIVDKYGEESLAGFAFFLAAKIIKNGEITHARDDEIRDKLDVEFENLVRKYSSEDFTFDVIPFAGRINTMSLDFDYDDPESIISNYLGRALRELDFEYEYPTKDLDQLLPILKARIVQEISNQYESLINPGLTISEKLNILYRVRNDSDASKFQWDPFSGAVNYLRDIIIEDVKSKLSGRLGELIDKYGAYNINAVIVWIAERESSFIWKLDPDQEEQVREVMEEALHSAGEIAA